MGKVILAPMEGLADSLLRDLGLVEVGRTGIVGMVRGKD